MRCQAYIFVKLPEPGGLLERRRCSREAVFRSDEGVELCGQHYSATLVREVRGGSLFDYSGSKDDDDEYSAVEELR